MAMPLSNSDREQIHAAIFAGRKIEAIKLYRDATGEGLKEAKDAVEAEEVALRKTSPGRFASGPSGGGCMSVILLLLVVVATLAALLRA